MKKLLTVKNIIIVLLLGIIAFTQMCNPHKARNKELQREVELKAQLIKEDSGQYSDLVVRFDKLKELKRQVPDSILDLLKEKDEKLISYGQKILTLESRSGETQVDIPQTLKDCSDTLGTLRLLSYYPDIHKPFIYHTGILNLDSGSYRYDWKFSDLPIQITLTETDLGFWNTRVIGPSWLVVDSINVVSLSREAINKPKFLSPILGAGIGQDFDQRTFFLQMHAGLAFRRKHMFLLSGTTNQTISISYLQNF